MTVAAGYRPTITAACCQTLVVEPGSDIQPQPRKSRASAVTTAASTTATITGVLSASATAATPTPRAFSSSSRWPPSPKVPVTTRAVSRAGVSSADTALALGGSSQPPASIGPAALMAALASVTATIETQSALTKTLPSSPTALPR